MAEYPNLSEGARVTYLPAEGQTCDTCGEKGHLVCFPVNATLSEAFIESIINPPPKGDKAHHIAARLEIAARHIRDGNITEGNATAWRDLDNEGVVKWRVELTLPKGVRLNADTEDAQ
jgi:hypothetical protein